MSCSQHQNGGAEVMVKLAKGVIKSLMHELGSQVLSLNELNTVLIEAANLVNSRPIGLKPNRDTDSEFLSPNSLLLGRNSDRSDSGPFLAKDKFDQGLQKDLERFRLVQSIILQFWRVWTTHYFPSLLVRRKWHFSQRNMRIGDICFLRDSNSMRGDFRRCRVSNVYPDRRGRIRNVEILATQSQNGSPSYHPQGLSRLKRHVSNLIVILPVEEADSTLESKDMVTNDNSNYRNLAADTPSDVGHCEADGVAANPLVLPVEGGRQVPTEAHHVSLVQDLGYEELSCQDMTKVATAGEENTSQEWSYPDELLPGNVNLDSPSSNSCIVTLPAPCTDLKEQTNSCYFQLPSPSICSATKL